MNLKITNSTKIKEVQALFHEAFPSLKIEFSDRSHEWGAPTKKAHWYDPSLKLSAIATKKFIKQNIDILARDKAGTVEELFKDRFGLFPQIFRREEDQWIETAGTDDLTLMEQNEIGQNSLLTTKDNLWIEREAFL